MVFKNQEQKLGVHIVTMVSVLHLSLELKINYILKYYDSIMVNTTNSLLKKYNMAKWDLLQKFKNAPVLGVPKI